MRATGKLGLAFAMAAVTCAQAQNMGWVRRPSPAELDAAYPVAAKTANLPGHVFLGCNLDVEGSLHSCAIVAETPRGQGFGKAALSLVPFMQASPRNQGPRLAPITIPVHFGPPAPQRPNRDKVFKTSDGRFSVLHGRFKSLAPAGPYWPDMALRTGLSGHAAIDCKVRDDGRLADCEMVGDRTSHPSFGYAMLAMARQGWMSAGAVPVGSETADGYWRFELDFPRRTLADVH